MPLDRREYLIQIEGPGNRPCITARNTWVQCQHCPLACILPQRITIIIKTQELKPRQRKSRPHVYPKNRKRPTKKVSL